MTSNKLFRDLIAALDAMPDKRLLRRHYENARGDRCALGACMRYVGEYVSIMYVEEAANRHGWGADDLWAVTHFNDTSDPDNPVSAIRWQAVRDWAATRLAKVATP